MYIFYLIQFYFTNVIILTFCLFSIYLFEEEITNRFSFY